MSDIGSGINTTTDQLWNFMAYLWDKELENNHLIVIVGVLVIFLIIIFTVCLWRIYKLEKKINNILEDKQK